MDIIISHVRANMIGSPQVEFPPTFKVFLDDNLISYKYSANIEFGDSVIFSDYGPNKHKNIYCDLLELKMLSEEEIKNYLIKHFELDGD